MQTKLTLFSWFVHGKANHCHKFTKLKFEDTKCKHGQPCWIWISLLFWQLETSGKVMEVDKQLKFKLHKCMQVEFILNNIDVMTHDCLSSVTRSLVFTVNNHLIIIHCSLFITGHWTISFVQLLISIHILATTILWFFFHKA